MFNQIPFIPYLISVFFCSSVSSLVLVFEFTIEISLAIETFDFHMAKPSSYNSVIIFPDNPIDLCYVEHSLLLKIFFFVFRIILFRIYGFSFINK